MRNVIPRPGALGRVTPLVKVDILVGRETDSGESEKDREIEKEIDGEKNTDRQHR